MSRKTITITIIALTIMLCLFPRPTKIVVDEGVEGGVGYEVNFGENVPQLCQAANVPTAIHSRGVPFMVTRDVDSNCLGPRSSFFPVSLILNAVLAGVLVIGFTMIQTSVRNKEKK